jgi:chromosomal replication initiation ATPase DnaA
MPDGSRRRKGEEAQVFRGDTIAAIATPAGTGGIAIIRVSGPGAILKKKAVSEELDVPNEVLVYIAGQIHSNIRELEGALIRVTACAALTNREINTQLAAEVIQDMIPSSRPKQISVEMIQRTVADYYHLEVSEMVSRTIMKHVLDWRKAIQNICSPAICWR